MIVTAALAGSYRGAPKIVYAKVDDLEGMAMGCSSCLPISSKVRSVYAAELPTEHFVAISNKEAERTSIKNKWFDFLILCTCQR